MEPKKLMHWQVSYIVYLRRRESRSLDPQMKVDVRFSDLDESVMRDVAVAIAESGECHPTEIRVEPIRTAPNGSA